MIVRKNESVSDLRSHLYVILNDKHNLLNDYEFNIDNVVYERVNSKKWIKKN